MRAVDALEVLELLGSTQRGLVTTAQARESGLSGVDLTRLTDSGKLLRVRHGVYALPSAGVDRLQDLRGAWLAATANGDVVVSGASAAVVHRLGDLVPAAHEFTAPVRRQSTLPDLRFHRAELTDNDVTVVDGLPVTTVVRTAADLAAASLDSDHLASVLSAAVEDQDVDVEELARALSPYATRYGFDSGRALLAEVAPGYLASALRSVVRAAVTRSPQFRKQALKLLEESDGAKTLVSLLEQRFAS
ncbi:type IV toxin-antitoxin system AbiEi family antitoxin domain-containing protein [Herbiconiux sp. VKM Ac-1786]|uniref:type IV toxin-antitoxin system AbiEi family antitoxin domain-containing protein n=1 Tax=Herbiconiux sp. VKM Ac-1786 TaxID=2783824 RepID=UPI00188D9CAC|nr:type IV toxin-antitoxin system AbiEi family antitoxin domain-containing protein [Herbiconiux sp. VKM Ac-1786]MBF4571261.1 type IV toxin-antitoxin system AbiEi family antitoxin domain-containing protein [Herbiconiux sp. VKM Ac-1786]